MTTLGDQVRYEDKWNPETINLQPVVDILNEAKLRHDVSDAAIADSLAKRLLIVADHLSDEVTKLKIYFTKTRSSAKDRLNDVSLSAIDAKSDAAKERVGLQDPKFRELRDEYKKAELLVTHLEIKFKELMSFHYSFKDTAKRLSGLSFAGSAGSDSDKHENAFGTPQLPLRDDKKEEDAF